MATEETMLYDLFSSVYLLLLVDQYEDGLWGKSIGFIDRSLYSGPEEASVSLKRKRAESITVTFFAVDSIRAFTKDPNNQAITRALNCLQEHRCDGGYGSFSELITAYPKPVYKILVSCRHTATALLTYLLFQEGIDEKTLQSTRFLIDHSNKDGGWGISADSTKADSDCHSTAYVVKLLIKLRKMDVQNLLSTSYASRLDASITKGLDWLEQKTRKVVVFGFSMTKG